MPATATFMSAWPPPIRAPRPEHLAKAREAVLKTTVALEGRIAAEHGIGMLKRNKIGWNLDEATLSLMHPQPPVPAEATRPGGWSRTERLVVPVGAECAHIGQPIAGVGPSRGVRRIRALPEPVGRRFQGPRLPAEGPVPRVEAVRLGEVRYRAGVVAGPLERHRQFEVGVPECLVGFD